MRQEDFDLVVIGAGPAGYVAAIRGAQLDMKVACVDPKPRLGGTCLNEGCIPSKALLDSTLRFREAREDLRRHGVVCEDPTVDLEALGARRDEAIEILTRGVDALFDKHGIERVEGWARLEKDGRVRVESSDGAQDGTRSLTGRNILIATGAAPRALPEVAVDGKRVLSSWDALVLDRIPTHLVVIGCGYVGLEIASVWSRLGARTTCVEWVDRILPGADHEMSEALRGLLESQGLELRLRSRVVDARVENEQVCLRIAPAGDEESQGDEEGGEDHAQDRGQEDLEASHVLVAVGRRPRSDGLGLEEVGVETDEAGFVQIDERFRTSVEGVYAIGDVAREPMLAHKAQQEAVACVEAIAGVGSGYVHYAAIPSVVYTAPELASVGATEEALQEQGVDYRVGRYRFRHDPRSVCSARTEGLVKILADSGTDRVLGAHVLGAEAGTLIHEIVVAIELGGSAEELGRTCHAHPTRNEAVREAALDVHGLSIHQ